jgi:hypothetical protein
VAVSQEAHSRIVQTLAHSSPLATEAAALLAQTSLLSTGLATTDTERAAGARPAAIRGDVSIADLVSGHAAVVSQAAPDLALAAPNFAEAAFA